MISWIKEWVDVWLFWILAGELIVGIYTAIILTKEYFYDFEKDRRAEVKRLRRQIKKELTK